ncbi:MAG: hypothetical protein RBS99_10220 [Rhodospirillales bacterium]|jgi:hypothetical protein|nr:hypothetical protein [Rhodospirillales bacterium]
MARYQQKFGSPRLAADFAADLLARGERVRVAWSGDGSFHDHHIDPVVRWGNAIRKPMSAAEVAAEFGPENLRRIAARELAVRRLVL